MIDQQTVQRILDTANILEVVGDYVSLRRRGASYVGLCPFHTDRHPSFYVTPSKNICKCFSCGEGGSPVHFLMKHEGISYPEALRMLAKKYGIAIKEIEETDEEKARADERQSLFLINEFAQDFFVRQLHETDEGRNIALAYFKERGIRQDIVQKFGLGYSPEAKNALTDTALKANYRLEKLVSVGLSVEREGGSPPIDRFRGRVIFPIRGLSGKYVGFGGRIMSSDKKLAKYINSPESLIYSKSRELYGLYWAKGEIAKADKCYLVEGYTDVISMHQCGIENVVSTSGTALTTEQIRLLRRFTSNVTVLYDGDAAGIKAALRGIDLLLEAGLIVKVVLLPDGEDPDSFAKKHSTDEVKSFLSDQETDFISFKIRLYKGDMERDPLKRAELIKDVMRSIAFIPDTIRRSVLIQSSAGDLGMHESVLAGEVMRLRASGVRASADYYRPEGRPEAPRPQPPQEVVGSDSLDLRQEGSEAIAEEQTPLRKGPEIHERELLALALSNAGQSILVSTMDDKSGTEHLEEWEIVSFLYYELDQDSILSILSTNALRILKELTDPSLRQGIPVERYFVDHEDAVIRSFAVTELMDPKNQVDDVEDIRQQIENDIKRTGIIPFGYSQIEDAIQAQIDKSEAKRKRDLGAKAVRVLDSLRVQIIVQQISELQKEVILAQRQGDEAKIEDLMRDIIELNKVKKALSFSLGERTIMG